MSTFNTYSSDKKYFNYFIKNAQRLNVFLIIFYVSFLLIPSVYFILKVISLILFVMFYMLYKILLKKLKTNGNIELTKTKIIYTTENQNIVFDKDNIEEIIIVKKLLKHVLFGEYKFVLIAVLCKDKSINHIIVDNSSTDREYEIIEVLKVFARINKIALEKNDFLIQEKIK